MTAAGQAILPVPSMINEPCRLVRDRPLAHLRFVEYQRTLQYHLHRSPFRKHDVRPTRHQCRNQSSRRAYTATNRRILYALSGESTNSRSGASSLCDRSRVLARVRILLNLCPLHLLRFGFQIRARYAQRQAESPCNHSGKIRLVKCIRISARPFTRPGRFTSEIRPCTYVPVGIMMRSFSTTGNTVSA